MSYKKFRKRNLISLGGIPHRIVSIDERGFDSEKVNQEQEYTIPLEVVAISKGFPDYVIFKGPVGPYEALCITPEILNSFGFVEDSNDSGIWRYSIDLLERELIIRRTNEGFFISCNQFSKKGQISVKHVHELQNTVKDEFGMDLLYIIPADCL